VAGVAAQLVRPDAIVPFGTEHASAGSTVVMRWRDYLLHLIDLAMPGAHRLSRIVVPTADQNDANRQTHDAPDIVVWFLSVERK
jgi:hypothetical protein